MAITYTKTFSSADDGSILTGSQMGTIQSDISSQAAVLPINSANGVNGASLTSLSSIPAGAGVIPVANLPASSVVPQARTAMYVMQASTVTMTVAPGSVEINGLIVSKTANTTLTLTTAGNWAGSVSLQAVNTTGYVGIDSAGNLKMHTTAPTHADYAVSITAANNTKRYVTWASTVYRVIGWFRMNATGSGELDTYGVSNIADGGVINIVEYQTGAVATGSTVQVFDDTIPQNAEGDQYLSQVFVPTNVNNKLRITVVLQLATGTGSLGMVSLFQDSTANALAAQLKYIDIVNKSFFFSFIHHMKAATTALTTFKVRAGTNAGTTTINGEAGARLLGGVLASSIRVEEIESQLT